MHVLGKYKHDKKCSDLSKIIFVHQNNNLKLCSTTLLNLAVLFLFGFVRVCKKNCLK